MKNLIKLNPITSIVILLLGAAWIYMSPAVDLQANGQQASFPRQGFEAPDFELFDLAGKPLRLSDLRGSPVVLNFWASWCPPCKAEMPAFKEIDVRFKDQGLQVLLVNATSQDELAAVEEFVRQKELVMTVLMDTNGQAEKDYQVNALPTTFFIDRQGIIQKVVIGGPLPQALLYAEVEKLLQGDH